MRSHALILGIAVLGSQALADINGFTPSAYQYNHDPADVGSPPILGPGSIQLTTGRNQRRSLFFHDVQDITEFTASFTYRAENVDASAVEQGLTFVVQRNAAGDMAIGDSVNSPLFGPVGLGYTGLTTSAAVAIALDTGSARTYSGFYTNGVLGGGGVDVFPVNAFSGNDIGITIVYSGTELTVTMQDLVTMVSSTPRTYLVGSLPTMLGGDTAFVGFTASTSGGSSFGGANQFLSDFRFTRVPTPATLPALGMLGFAALRRRR